MTRLHRAFIPTIVITAALVTGALGWAGSASSTTAPKTYSVTVAGTDLHSLDPLDEAKFVPGGGMMAVYEKARGSGQVVANFEAGLDLPNGAKVTSIQTAFNSCAGPSAELIFGSYQPTTRNTVQAAKMELISDCANKSLTRTGNPIATVAAGRRYVIDFEPNSESPYPGTQNENVFYGAVVKYTCTSPCVP